MLQSDLARTRQDLGNLQSEKTKIMYVIGIAVAAVTHPSNFDGTYREAEGHMKFECKTPFLVLPVNGLTLVQEIFVLLAHHHCQLGQPGQYCR
jgi:hypothetical protein